MKNGLLCLLLGLSSIALHAQDPLGKLIVGLETGFEVKQYHDDYIPRIIPGIQVETSFWRFSVGVGLSRKFYHEYQYVFYKGKNKVDLVDGQPVTTYLYDVKGFKPAYWSVPIKLNFRVHRCNCVYIHAATMLEFLDSHKPERTVFVDAQSKDVLPYGVQRKELMHMRTRSFEFGIGIKLFAIGNMRVYARPTYVISQKPEVYVDNKYGATLRMSFGAQFGLFN
jgi:hypothetical protein